MEDVTLILIIVAKDTAFYSFGKTDVSIIFKRYFINEEIVYNCISVRK